MESISSGLPEERMFLYEILSYTRASLGEKLETDHMPQFFEIRAQIQLKRAECTLLINRLNTTKTVDPNETTMEDLLYKLAPYVSLDDVALDKDTFRRTVASRINDDLGELT